MKYIYFFGAGKAEGTSEMRELLGGKGAGLAEMTRIGLPVPAGFTITTQACAYYLKNKKYPRELHTAVAQSLARLEKLTRRKLGDAENPLLVSVRSGAARSMPGMMETVLNLGLNDKSVEGLARATRNERFAYDAYRRFVQMYSTVVNELPKDDLEEKLRALKARLKVKDDTQVTAYGWKKLIAEYKAYYKQKKGTEFPQDPQEQLWGAIGAVFQSWLGEKAQKYRVAEKIPDDAGTAASVVQMVFGNTGEDSGTGVCFTRDPSTGEKVFFGEFLVNAQGEDVVAGIRTPLQLTEMKRVMPHSYKQLEQVRTKLEKHFRDMQDMEFTVENGKLYMLQTRNGKRSPSATFRIAVDMVGEKLITVQEALERVKPEDIERLFYPVIDPKVQPSELRHRLVVTGNNAVPGAAVGKAIFSAHETSPEDVGGMYVAQGILTATGGKTSHAAVVARGWGKCCIVGAENLEIDLAAKAMKANGRTVREGEWITLDGSDGSVYTGEVPLIRPEPPEAFATLLKWADKVRRLRVRTNADTPQDARLAREMGAEGIGLCRTEHMFFKDFEFPERSAERQLAIQEMILARNAEDRKKALNKLQPFQRRDFIGIFEAMDGFPVTIRLIDPPLHEFIPHEPEKQAALAAKIGIPVEEVAQRVSQLYESNPMLGHRGCRLSITYPEILDMQVGAMIEAAVDCKKRGIQVSPEIMHPLVMDKKELQILSQRTREVADRIIRDAKVKLEYIVGTMIELPRAALLAREIAEVAEFFSFGTNDLTQTTMGLSRDDAGRFLPVYIDERQAGIFKFDPFQTLDIAGVGILIEWAIVSGRKERPKLKVGICGEHGGDGPSVKFCHRVGMDYVSASPFRVAIARLAAAQAVIEERKIGTRGGKNARRQK